MNFFEDPSEHSFATIGGRPSNAATKAHRALRIATAAWLIAILALATGGCAGTPIGVNRADPREVQRKLNTNVLLTDELSASTLRLLYRLGLRDQFQSEPERTLAALREGLAPTGDQARVYALAELWFAHAESSGKRAHYLAAAVYAYAYLFPGRGKSAPSPFDTRFRAACDLYNRGLAAGLTADDGDHVDLKPGRYELPFGQLEIVGESAGFQWAGYKVDDFVPAANFRVRGLRNRYRHDGIGAPLSASISGPATAGEAPPGADRIPPDIKVPVTAFMRIDEPRAGIREGVLAGELHVYSPDDSLTIEIDGAPVPLEFDATTALALSLDSSRLWEFELGGFRSGELRVLSTDNRELPDGLIMLRPHRPGTTPVVLVHGTASSPARWAQMVNELENDDRIWDRFQVWLFIYNTGNPIAYSGGLLAQALRDAVQELDPENRDPALRRMVVIGHSQGGLLTKLTSVDSGNRVWSILSDVPIDELELQPETRAILQRSLFFEALPFVERLIFIATPFRGSFLTEMRWGKLNPSSWAKSLVKIPKKLTDVVGEAAAQMVRRDPNAKLQRQLDRLPTSIDNMTPGNPFLVTLEELPIDPRVTTHTIIAVRGDGPPEEGNDGVVKYSSAHLDGAASQLVVHSSHSTQGTPPTIEAVRRILLEHAGLDTTAVFEPEP